MKKRTHEIKLRLTEQELARLNDMVTRSRHSRESFIRAMLDGYTIKEAPPADFYKLWREVRRVGINIDQLTRLSRARGWLSTKELEKAMDETREVEILLVDTFTDERNGRSVRHG